MQSTEQLDASGNRPVRPGQKPGLTARALATISLVLWLLSLIFVGLSNAGGSDGLPGMFILAIGWVAILDGHFAWLANPLFIWVFVRICSRKQSMGIAVVCILLALDTARFDGIHMLGSGTYAYGWGAVLWMTAFCLMLAAAGTLEIERAAAQLPVGQRHRASRDFGYVRFMGFALTLLVLTATAILSYHDHSKASPAELARLGTAAFKKYAVCTLPEPKAEYQVDIANGIVEVIFSDPNDGAAPFDNPSLLLEWGLPMVRYDGRDYYIGQLDGKKVTFSEPASRAPVVQLFVTRGADRAGGFITTKLVVRDQVLFDQIWRYDRNGDACPDFESHYPKAEQQPRKLLIDSIRVGGNAPVALVKETQANQADSTVTVAKIVTVKDYKEGLVEDGTGGRYVSLPKANSEYVGTRGCPDRVGWVRRDVKGIKSPRRMSDPFLIDEKLIYLDERKRHQALCQGAFIYFWTPMEWSYGKVMVIEKRSIANLQTVWKTNVAFENQIAHSHINELILARVIETDRGVNLTVINKKNMTEVELALPLTDPLKP